MCLHILCVSDAAVSRLMEGTRSAQEQIRVGSLESLASLPREFLMHYLHSSLELSAQKQSRWSLLQVLLDASRAHASEEDRALFVSRPQALPPMRPPAKKPAPAAAASAAAPSPPKQADESVDRFFAESRAAAVRALCTVARAVGIRALLGGEHSDSLEVIFAHLFLAFSDYTRTNRGDVGRLYACTDKHCTSTSICQAFAYFPLYEVFVWCMPGTTCNKYLYTISGL